MKDDLYQIFNKMSLSSRDDVYRFLARNISSRDYQLVNNELYNREMEGSIQIEEGVVLPHIELSCITKTKVMIITLKQPIKNWNETIDNIDLIIGIALCSSDKNAKEKVIHFIRKLANAEFIKRLKQINVISELLLTE